MIYFAIENGVVYATCMAQPMTNNEWEICKLAADERYEGHGAGSAVFKAQRPKMIVENLREF